MNKTTSRKNYTLWEDKNLVPENYKSESPNFTDTEIREISARLSQIKNNSLEIEIKDKCSEIVLSVKPDFKNYVDILKSKIKNGYRFVLVKKFGFAGIEDNLIREKFCLGVCNLLGRPTETDQITKKIVWPIKVDPKNTIKDKTFSEHNLEAELHTDTQFFENPETAFGLFCIAPDKNNEGINDLVDARTVKVEILKLEDGAGIIEILSTPNFIFKIPTSFSKSGKDEEPEFTTTSIFGNEVFFRYRKDTLYKGHNLSKIPLTKEQIYALSVLDEVMSRQELSFQNLLSSDDAIFVNNHEICHARTSFSDLSRHLYRIRFNTYE